MDAGDVAKQIAKREELGSTGVGNGVALPHARLQRAQVAIRPAWLGCTTASTLKPSTIEPVDIVFLLLLPDAPDETQLNALACAARALRDPVVRERVRAAADRETLFRALADSGGD